MNGNRSISRYILLVGGAQSITDNNCFEMSTYCYLIDSNGNIRQNGYKLNGQSLFTCRVWLCRSTKIGGKSFKRREIRSTIRVGRIVSKKFFVGIPSMEIGWHLSRKIPFSHFSLISACMHPCFWVRLRRIAATMLAAVCYSSFSINNL